MQTTAQALIEYGPNLSVGILSADLLRLGDELGALDEAGVELVHVDVMDGVFCPHTTVGPPVVNALPNRFVKDVHLMVDEPLQKVHAYVEAGAGILVFHVESTRHPHRVLQSLGGKGLVRGVALNPGTPVETITPLLDELELVLLLGVNPGWGGQSFIRSTEGRVGELRTLVDGREIAIGVDGGITKSNAEQIASLGVDILVTGSAIYDGAEPANNAREMLESISRGRGRVGITP
ncbi:MAG TPA: ribulose-phosphate 3-epimerase [Solirubrobacteraceae bacterium]|jgi:ribulose-phosphate 3-epimerase